ncbi:hypothetical protein SAMN05421841_1821 [Chryseobacterium wanjuense]|uniref:Uncharacterized protein n=1 Tax=Chryseobacterium wanjuense TaxID=356305 RepID=A0A1I0QD73_9FLAO|nr:hypothetical protein SAMN05421841_1821 [Chryseobacterium wanjuense]
MKRAKIILFATVLLAVVGGTVAFKATRIPQQLYFNNAAGICTLPTTLPLTLQPQIPGQPIFTVTNLYYTTRLNTSCPLTTWYTIN